MSWISSSRLCLSCLRICHFHQWTSLSSLIHRILRLLSLALYPSPISCLKHPTYLIILRQNRRLHHSLPPLLLRNLLSRFRFLLRAHQRAPLLRRQTRQSHFAAHGNTSLVVCFCIRGDGALVVSLGAGAAARVVCETGSVAGARVDDCAVWKAHLVLRYMQSSQVQAAVFAGVLPDFTMPFVSHVRLHAVYTSLARATVYTFVVLKD
jgi:hypothetical protein